VIPLTLREIATAVHGSLVAVPDPDAVVVGPVVADSRVVGDGGLFVALVGDHADGHDFAAEAFAAGAVAVLSARPVGGPAIVVDDVLLALGRLARAVVDRLPGLTVVAVTGSAGKTSTKDLLAQVLDGLGPTVAPSGSFNNELGLPLTVLSVDAGTRFLVLEMGARGEGHIAYLCGVAPPDVAVVLMVGAAHVGEFGSIAAIADAKAEIVTALAPEGQAVLNADDRAVRAMASSTSAPVTWFGTAPDADVRATDVHTEPTGRAAFVLSTAEGRAAVSLQLVGEHHVANALAAAAVATHFGATVQQVADALSRAVPRSRWRMEVVERADGVTVINDAYNASPESVHAALKTLAAMGQGRRTWAVLGEMRELGEASTVEHERVGRLAVRLDIDRLVVVGAAAEPIYLAACLDGSGGEKPVLVPDPDAAVALLRRQVRPGDVVLVKAARAVGLERVASALLEGSAPAEGQR